MVITRNVPSAFATEAIACLHAARLGLSFGFRDVIVEGNSLTVIRKATSPQPDTFVLFAYIPDI